MRPDADVNDAAARDSSTDATADAFSFSPRDAADAFVEQPCATGIERLTLELEPFDGLGISWHRLVGLGDDVVAAGTDRTELGGAVARLARVSATTGLVLTDSQAPIDEDLGDWPLPIALAERDGRSSALYAPPTPHGRAFWFEETDGEPIGEVIDLPTSLVQISAASITPSGTVVIGRTVDGTVWWRLGDAAVHEILPLEGFVVSARCDLSSDLGMLRGACIGHRSADEAAVVGLDWTRSLDEASTRVLGDLSVPSGNEIRTSLSEDLLTVAVAHEEDPSGRNSVQVLWAEGGWRSVGRTTIEGAPIRNALLRVVGGRLPRQAIVFTTLSKPPALMLGIAEEVGRIAGPGRPLVSGVYSGGGGTISLPNMSAFNRRDGRVSVAYGRFGSSIGLLTLCGDE
jgi:hypothetical protein